MFFFFITICAQFFITTADAFIRSQPHPIWHKSPSLWFPRYLLPRFTGLIMRLYAVFVLPIAGASMLFSSSAITVSSFVAWRHGEPINKREWTAILLIGAAVIVRAL